MEKPIQEFTKDDTFYMQKSVNGFMHTFHLSFESFKSGVVKGKIISPIEPNKLNALWLKKVLYKEGVEISGRISSCYTRDSKNNCRWFKKEGGNWKCI